MNIFSSYSGKRAKVIPILQKVQLDFGYLPEDAMKKVAEFCGITESEVFGIASFYTQFRFVPLGKKQIAVCRGTACHVKGAPRILGELEKVLGIKEGETTRDLEYTLSSVACIGCCGLAPCITINKDVHGRLTPNVAAGLLSRKKQQITNSE